MTVIGPVPAFVYRDQNTEKIRVYIEVWKLNENDKK